MPNKTGVLFACLFMIFVAFITLLYLILNINDPSAKYRFMVCLLCFCLSALMGLMFVSNAKLEGTAGAFSITVGGPSAVFLVTLLVFNSIYPERKAPGDFDSLKNTIAAANKSA